MREQRRNNEHPRMGRRSKTKPPYHRKTVKGKTGKGVGERDVPDPYGGDERDLEADAAQGSTGQEDRAGAPLHLDLEENLEGYTPERLGEIPNSAGIYMLRGRDGDVLYVGKSVQLRTRVRSYFATSGDNRLQVAFLRGKIASVEVIPTRSEKEALLLENALIKQYKPRYNFRLTDDKSYYSIKLDRRKEFPRLEFVRTRNVRPSAAGSKVEYFGPFHSSESVKKAIGVLQKIFPLRTCTDHVMHNRSRPCILHEIGKCCAPCVLPVTGGEYGELMDGARLFLTGKSGEVKRRLRAQMEEAAEALEFERAARLRDQIGAIERTLEEQTVARIARTSRDVVVLRRQAAKLCFVVFHYGSKGLMESEHFLEKDPGHDSAGLLRQFILQYYGEGREVPASVFVDAEPEDRAELEEFLNERRSPENRRKIKLEAPQRGEKRRAVELAALHAEQILERTLSGEKTRGEILQSLQKKLHLPEPPRRIECFDISTIQGAHNVGAMTSFYDAKPDKANYRQFKIKSLAAGEADDFAAMKEVLERRYRRVLAEGTPLPDLIVIDGGKGQLGMAVEVLNDLGVADQVPVVGLAKARLKEAAAGTAGEYDETTGKVRTEERVFLPGRKNPVLFRRDAPALFLLQRIRDETHRFVITFHRKQRSKSTIKSQLEEIPGIGPARRRALLRHFGSLSKIKEATLDELAACPGISRPAAEKLYLFLRED